MSWLCDICGYENEYSDQSQTTKCLCCGEPASERKIIKAQRDLEAYHREEDRKARIEEQKRKRELRQQKVDHIVSDISRMVRAIPVVEIAIIIISFIWVGISFFSDGKSLLEWNTQMYSNIKDISLMGYTDRVRDNLSDIQINEKIFVMLEGANKLVANHLSDHFSAISKNIINKNDISAYDYLSKIEEALNKPIFVENNYLSDKILIAMEDCVNDLKLVGEHIPIISKNMISSSLNIKINFPVFFKLAKDNVQDLINTITGKEGVQDE